MITVNGRVIRIPTKAERCIGFEGDSKVESRIFQVDRFYEGIDLAPLRFVLETKIGEAKDVTALDKSFDEQYVYLTWEITERNTHYPGVMDIQLVALSETGEIWHSNVSYVKVNASINVEEGYPIQLPSEFKQLETAIIAAKDEAVAAAAEARAAFETDVDIESIYLEAKT